MTRPSCEWEGPHFGASYPDATCVEGYLWDLDSCHEPGGPLYSGGDTPCPNCNTVEYLDWLGDLFVGGNAHQRRLQRRLMIRKIKSQVEAYA